MMYVYILELKDGATTAPNDYYDGFAVIAPNSKQARRTAHDADHGDNDSELWLKPEYTSCRRARSDCKTAAVLLSSFIAG